MRSNKMLVAGLLGAAATLSAPAALAQARMSQADTGYYAGGSIGQMEADGACPGGFTCDFKDSSFKIFGGYRINRNFAAEAFWGEWGEISVTSGGVTGAAEARTIGVAGLGIWPVGNEFEVFGKIGIGSTKMKATGSAPGVTVVQSDSGSEIVFGFGATYNFTRNFGVRAEWERLNDAEADVMSIGLQYRF